MRDDCGEAWGARCRRLIYRASHRGTREMDFLLGRFVMAHLPRWDEPTLRRWEALIGEADPDLGRWIFAAPESAPEAYHTLIFELRRFHGLQN